MIKEAPMCIGWSFSDDTCLAFVSGKGPLMLWHYTETRCPDIVRDSQNLSSDVALFRWHPKKQGTVAFGHTDGSITVSSIGSKTYRHILAPEVEGGDEMDPVTALAWDPLSTDYLLVANKHCGVRLIDATARAVIMSFQLPSSAAEIQTLCWVHNAPGMFVTGDVQSGVLRIWSVANTTPIENIRIKKSGFHELHVISMHSPTLSKPLPSNEQQHVSSTSEAQRPTLTPHTHFAVPHVQLMCTFRDGGVGLYDLGHRRWKFFRDQGHLETIFDCKFKPDNPNYLATGSFDGTIKVWNIITMEAVATSAGNEGIIYHISWAPGDLNCIACSTAKNGIFIWDMNKGKVIKRIHDHGDVSVFSLAWNQQNSKLIMSCGADGFCMIHQVDGKLVHKYKHPAPVYGGDWCPFSKEIFATGCEDSLVRIFCMGTSDSQPIKTLAGHTAKAFHVRWSPLREAILCSGADDCTVRVWNYIKEECVCKLSGHTQPVRGLTWNHEIPYLLISGSWDNSIRVWDTRDGACIYVVLDHGSDVYGLTCHPEQPFLLASSSRDSTLRLWSLMPLLQPLELSILADMPPADVFSTPERAMSQGTNPKLTGSASENIRDRLHRITGPDSHRQLIICFSKFFSLPMGTENLWDLVTLATGTDVMMLSPNYRNGIVHSSHLTKFKASQAQELEMVKMSKFGGGVGAPTKEIDSEKLLAYISALETSNDIVNSWWNLTRYCQYLHSKDNEDIIPFCVAMGDAQQLVTYLHDNGQLMDAVIASQAACEETFCRPQLCESYERVGDGKLVPNKEADSNECLLKKSMAHLSAWYFSNGSAVLAACCHLAVDDFQGAMSKLIRGNELELAVSVGRAGLPSMDACLSRAELLQPKEGSVKECVEMFLLSPEPERGLAIGLAHVKEKLATANWVVPDVFDLLQLLGCIRTDKLQHHKNSKMMYELLALSAYLGALVAIRRGYNDLVTPLFKHTREMMSKEVIELPFNLRDVEHDLETWTKYTSSVSAGAEPSQSHWRKLHKRLGTERWPVEYGPDCVSSSHLPSHSDVHVSVITGQRIRGLAVFLEDGKSAVSVNEALMWAKVNPFSPLGSGMRINPF
ncbi:hypothetical protein C0Q70_06530 [Pomacea canaliculata]|uniref:Uncharacterized protein n=1 Tax=Pomacea canaliculata TaxID=400727 RepID=A0A2T7PP98_POMCA|nr:hypothetical protein C0Q70_06530 [Pomacea canaliculata]